MIKRWLSIDPDKSILMIGPRRAGKTTLLKQRFSDYSYFTLDDLDYLDWAKRDPKGFILAAGQNAVIDEIQRFPGLTVAVKHAIDNHGAVFMMTGSSSIGLLDASADTLAGRIDMLSLPTLCWGEETGAPSHRLFKDQANPIQIKEADRGLKNSILYGHFPEVICEKDCDSRSKILRNYKNTYFTRDLMQLANIENLEGLLAILINLARSVGSHLEVSNFAREAGVSHPTAKKYLNTLLQSQLTFRLYGYQYGPAKRYIKAAKTYFSDNGIIHSLNVSLNEGQLLENFVIAELEKRRKLGYIRADQFFYYKSTSGREIDLIFETEDEVYAIEIKATAKPGPRDVRSLIEFGKSLKQPTQLFLFYQGTEYRSLGEVKLIPIASLYKAA